MTETILSNSHVQRCWCSRLIWDLPQLVLWYLCNAVFALSGLLPLWAGVLWLLLVALHTLDAAFTWWGAMRDLHPRGEPQCPSNKRMPALLKAESSIRAADWPPEGTSLWRRFQKRAALVAGKVKMLGSNASSEAWRPNVSVPAAWVAKVAHHRDGRQTRAVDDIPQRCPMSSSDGSIPKLQAVPAANLDMSHIYLTFVQFLWCAVFIQIPLAFIFVFGGGDGSKGMLRTWILLLYRRWWPRSKPASLNADEEDSKGRSPLRLC